jgi:uncharacterized protein (DUF1778 family)
MMNPSTTSVLSVRVNSDERAILEAAAAQAHTSLSDFVRRRALEAAEAEVLNRTTVTIPAKDWEAFEAWINRPAETIMPLVELAERVPSWER